MAKHSAESLLSRHPAISREYADSTARTGASGFTSADLGLLAWQKDNNTIWLLTATTPSWVGGSGGLTTLPGYLYGLTMSADSPGTYCYIEPGLCRNDDDDDFIVASSQITITRTASGVNGLDTGSVASDTWYYVFLIYNPTTTTTSAVYSLSRTSPTMPSGYTKKRFLGAIRTDGDSDFSYFKSSGMDSTKYIQYEDAHAVLSGGTSTTWVDIDCSTYVPQDARSCEIMVEQGAASGTVYVRPNGTTRNWQYVYGYNSVSRCHVDSSRYLEYRVVGSGVAYVSILGYYEDL